MAQRFTGPDRPRGGGKAIRLAAASETMANARRIGQASLCALAVALLLGAAPQEARAGACQAKGIKPKTGCVTSSDIKLKKDGRKKVPVIGQKHRRDEAGVAFDDTLPVDNKRVEHSGAFGPTEIFTGIESKVPAAGVIVITASAVIVAVGADEETFGSVKCDILAGGSVLFNDDDARQRINGFAGSVDAADGIPSDTMEFLIAFEVASKGTLSLDLVCGFLIQLGVSTNAGFGDKQILMRPPSLTAQYFPTRYCRRKRDGTCR